MPTVREKELEAIEVLKVIVAEFNSDPMSVQCFDLRTVNQAKEIVNFFDQESKTEFKVTFSVQPNLEGDKQTIGISMEPGIYGEELYDKEMAKLDEGERAAYTTVCNISHKVMEALNNDQSEDE